MTVYGWDASHHDWDPARGPMDIAAAVRDGITFMTHKIGEAGSFTDERYDDFYTRARAAKVPLLGAYYVNHPGDQFKQADRFLALLDARAPGWRTGPFILQVDAEKFDYMDRAPNLAEIRAFCDRLVARTDGRFRPIVYAPKWLYGDVLRGLAYPLWASNYSTNPAVRYRTAYPGDTSSRWAPYSGQAPVILQFGSRTIIGTQGTCDANAFRGTLAELAALTRGDDMTLEEIWHQNIYADTATSGKSATAATALLTLYENLPMLRSLAGKVDQLLARPPADFDEAAFAAALAPMLEEALERIGGGDTAAEIAAEFAARLAQPRPA